MTDGFSFTLSHDVVYIYLCRSSSDLLVFEPLPVDEEDVASQQFAGQQPADAHSAQAAVLRQPAAARIVSGHHHRFDAHNVAVTAHTHTHSG